MINDKGSKMRKEIYFNKIFYYFNVKKGTKDVFNGNKIIYIKFKYVP